MIGLFDMFKVGIGPSSSHTIGPMKAGKQFVDDLVEKGLLNAVTRVAADICGSLSLTGKSHHTDTAIIMGLAGSQPDIVDIDAIPAFIRDVETRGRPLLANGQHEIDFPADDGMRFRGDSLPLHEDGMTIHAQAGEKEIYCKTYYSIGDGFTVGEEYLGKENANRLQVPYPFKSTQRMLAYCRETGLSLSGMVIQSGLALHSKKEVEDYFANVWQTIRACIGRGINTESALPGPLHVSHRASALRRLLVASDKLSSDPTNVADWVNTFAPTVNEENAAGGRVVTASTSGACGIVPMILAYYDHFIEPVSPEIYVRYFMACGAIDALYKVNTPVSGAEVDCQSEVGITCSMAIAGLAELLGASPEQAYVVAEIGMEHNLGLACNPITGRVRMPCVEHNAIVSVKTVDATRMAMRRTSEPRISLDRMIETIYEAGKDTSTKYRRTSRGGLVIKAQYD